MRMKRSEGEDRSDMRSKKERASEKRLFLLLVEKP